MSRLPRGVRVGHVLAGARAPRGIRWSDSDHAMPHPASSCMSGAPVPRGGWATVCGRRSCAAWRPVVASRPCDATRRRPPPSNPPC